MVIPIDMTMTWMVMTTALAGIRQSCMPVAHEIQYVWFDQEFYWIWLLYYKLGSPSPAHTHAHDGDGHDSTQSQPISNFKRALQPHYTCYIYDSCVCNKPIALNTNLDSSIGAAHRHMDKKRSWYRYGCILNCGVLKIYYTELYSITRVLTFFSSLHFSFLRILLPFWKFVWTRPQLRWSKKWENCVRMIWIF